MLSALLLASDNVQFSQELCAPKSLFHVAKELPGGVDSGPSVQIKPTRFSVFYSETMDGTGGNSQGKLQNHILSK